MITDIEMDKYAETIDETTLMVLGRYNGIKTVFPSMNDVDVMNISIKICSFDEELSKNMGVLADMSNRLHEISESIYALAHVIENLDVGI
jgi:hypothetical protein